MSFDKFVSSGKGVGEDSQAEEEKSGFDGQFPPDFPISSLGCAVWVLSSMEVASYRFDYKFPSSGATPK